MSNRPAIFELLLASRNLAADDALAAALARVPGETARYVVSTLLERGRPVGLNALVSEFHLLDAELREQITASAHRLYGALRECSQNPNLRVRLNVVQLIEQSRQYRLAYLLIGGLHDGSPKVREAAARALSTLTDRLLTAQSEMLAEFAAAPTREPDVWRERSASLASHVEDRRQLASALQKAAKAYPNHRRPEVIEAALWLVDTWDEKTWEWFTAPGSRVNGPVLEQLGGVGNPRLSSFLIEALAHSPLRSTVRRTLASRRSEETAGEFLAQSWRLARPRVRRAAVAVRSIGWLEAHASFLFDMSNDAAVHAARWIRLCGWPTARKIDLLQELLVAGRPEVQRAALWALIDLDDEFATPVLRTVIEWNDPRLSPIAFREFRRRRPVEAASMVAEEPGSPPLSAAGLTQRPGDGADEARGVDLSADPDFSDKRSAVPTFAEYWRGFDQMEPARRKSIGAAVWESFPDALEELKAKLRGGGAPERHRALRIARDVDKLGQVSELVYECARDPDDAVRAEAVAALGHLGGPTAERLARTGLLDSDRQVQQRAGDISATPSAGGTGIPAIEAVESRAESAVKALVGMLSHQNPGVRLEAVRAMRKLGLGNTGTRLAELAEEDPDPTVRREAARIAADIVGTSADPWEEVRS